MLKAWGKLIVALDVTDSREYTRIITELRPRVKFFKVGPIAYFAMGPKSLSLVKKNGGRVFLDFKLHDIPNTMLKTAKNFVDKDVWAFTVHTKAGEAALRFLKKELSAYARKKGKKCPMIIGVTELTSDNAGLSAVMKLVGVAQRSGIDGVVSSVWEAKEIKKKSSLKVITPGIRNKKCGDDQKRIASAATAQKQGADFFVVGRPIIKAKDYLAAAREVLSL
jgi:orotidine-5'-phosphate decarboxylase